MQKVHLIIVLCLNTLLCLFEYYSRVKANTATTRVDLYVNGELLDPAEDRRLVGKVPLRDKTVSCIQFHCFQFTLSMGVVVCCQAHDEYLSMFIEQLHLNSTFPLWKI